MCQNEVNMLSLAKSFAFGKFMESNYRIYCQSTNCLSLFIKGTL